jgi:hypothetical protein
VYEYDEGKGLGVRTGSQVLGLMVNYSKLNFFNREPIKMNIVQ